jgi:SPP1 family predicted phage head-tail adaptor
MNPGRLRHKIDIQQELTTQNTYGEPTHSWVTFLSSVPASIEPIRGREYFASDKMNAEITHRIRMRFRLGVKAKMRVKYCGRYFDIESAINVDEGNEWYELMCREVDADV